LSKINVLAGTVMSLHLLPWQLRPNQTTHNICTIKHKPLLRLKHKPVWTNGIWPNRTTFCYEYLI